ncbi:uncharacterized protein [Diadema antillarum]|uniref:uncharacterized protein n=1 Tax=Diadema antillarum TaxID=105358 RepID=UPI003A8ACADA
MATDSAEQTLSPAASPAKEPEERSLIGTVSIKLPPFWANDPQIWFAQAEAQFSTRGISKEETKYAYVIAALSPEVAQDVRDLIVNPPSANQYTKLKQTLIARMSESEQRRVKRLLTEEELGDRKPSQLLRRMEQLVGDQTLEKGILKQLFLQRLPQNVRLILASTSDALTLQELAELADRIVDAHVPGVNTMTASPPIIAPVSSSGGNSRGVTPPATLAQLTSELAEVKRALIDLTFSVKKMQQRGRSRSRSTAGRGAKTPSQHNGQHGQQSQGANAAAAASSDQPGANTQQLCFYHYRFGANAHRCTQPCSYKGNDVTSG